MLSTFDVARLGDMLRDFYTLTGIRITVFDDTFREITSYPDDIDAICRFIRSDPAAAEACRACDRAACALALERHAPYIYHCHSGLTDAVTPVCLNGTAVAYLSFGHLFSYPSREDGRAEILHRCARYALDPERLASYVDALPAVDDTYILSAARVMEAVASYLCLERMITPEQQSLQRRIDEYLSEHLAEDISVDTLCEHFGIGRTRLYAIASRSYGTGIAGHIRRLRADRAEQLLLETDMPLSEIAEACGFHDYSYFITVFTRIKGTSPHRLRVQHRA